MNMHVKPNSLPMAADETAGGASARLVTLTQESRFLHFLMAHFPDRIYFKDLKSRFIYGSKSFARLFNLEDITEFHGKTDFDYFSEAHARAAY